MTPTGHSDQELKAGAAFVMLCVSVCVFVCAGCSGLNEWVCVHTAICVCLCMFVHSLMRAYACVS